MDNDITMIKDLIKEAKPDIEEALQKNSAPLFMAISILLQGHDEDDLFASYNLKSTNKFKNDEDEIESSKFINDEDEMAIFKKAFNKPIFSPDSKDADSRVDDIVKAALAFIGLHYSGKNIENIETSISSRMKRRTDILKNALYDIIPKPFNIKHPKIAYFLKLRDNSKKDNDISAFNKAMQKIGLGVLRMKEDFLFMALMIAGIWVIVRYLSDKEDKLYSNLQSSDSVSLEEPETPIGTTEKNAVLKSATMLLLIPANKLPEIKEKEIFTSDKTGRLIDASVYYGCFSENEAKEIESGMNLKKGDFSEESAQYVYITLSIEDGKDMMDGSSLKFSLKKCLRSKPREFTVSKIRLLENLDGVNRLNRI